MCLVRYELRFQNLWKMLLNRIQRFLIWSLENRIKVLIAIVICVVLSISLVPLKMIKSEYMPTADQGSIYTFYVAYRQVQL